MSTNRKVRKVGPAKRIARATAKPVRWKHYWAFDAHTGDVVHALGRPHVSPPAFFLSERQTRTDNEWRHQTKAGLDRMIARWKKLPVSFYF